MLHLHVSIANTLVSVNRPANESSPNHSSPVRNCALPMPNDQSSSELICSETITSDGATSQRSWSAIVRFE